MKKIIFLFTISLISLTAKAQYSYTKHEITLDILSPRFKHYTISYEQTLTDSEGVGIQIGFGADKKLFYDNFSATPFYRYYAMGDEAKGFFLEGFVKVSNYDYDDDGQDYQFKGIGVAPGIGLGYKGVFDFGLIIGFNVGGGYNFTKFELDRITKRGGLFIGWRF